MVATSSTMRPHIKHLLLADVLCYGLWHRNFDQITSKPYRKQSWKYFGQAPVVYPNLSHGS